MSETDASTEEASCVAEANSIISFSSSTMISNVYMLSKSASEKVDRNSIG